MNKYGCRDFRLDSNPGNDLGRVVSFSVHTAGPQPYKKLTKRKYLNIYAMKI